MGQVVSGLLASPVSLTCVVRHAGLHPISDLFPPQQCGAIVLASHHVEVVCVSV